jgi:hypothetical protein
MTCAGSADGYAYPIQFHALNRPGRGPVAAIR